LKFRAVFEKYKFPALSAFCALTNAKSPKIVSYSTNLFPWKILVFLTLDKISGFPVPF
jgi:hypothetical protein